MLGYDMKTLEAEIAAIGGAHLLNLEVRRLTCWFFPIIARRISPYLVTARRNSELFSVSSIACTRVRKTCFYGSFVRLTMAVVMWT